MKAAPLIAALACALALSACSGSAPDPIPTPTLAISADSVSPRDWRPSDLGTRSGAMGTAILDADSVPIAYVVVEGDTPDGVRARFDLPWFSLAREDGTFMPHEALLLVGEKLTFTLPKQ